VSSSQSLICERPKDFCKKSEVGGNSWDMRIPGFVLVARGILLAALGGGIAFGQTIFTKVTESAVVNDLGALTGFAWGDFRNTGFLDLFVSSFRRIEGVVPFLAF
jgi:hypothetical protein